METRARYLLIGLFLLAAISAGFGFVYWLNHAGGLGPRLSYRIRFQTPVLGLDAGSAVLFNGIKVGEVSEIEINQQNPRQVLVLISVNHGVPVRSDTDVSVETQGLLGSPAISLKGGEAAAPAAPPGPSGIPELNAGPDAALDAMGAARDTLRSLTNILNQNGEALHTTIANLATFSEALARNSEKIDSLIDGLSHMVGPQTKPPVALYDLRAASDLPAVPVPGGQLAVADPTAVLAIDSQRILTETAGLIGSFPDAQWSDSLPRLLQEKVIQSLENAHYTNVARASDAFQPDRQLLLDVHTFKIVAGPAPVADVEFSAKILEAGKIVAAQVFHTTAPVGSSEVGAAVESLNEACATALKALVGWVLAGG